MTDLSGLTPAEQVRALGLVCGDVIQGKKLLSSAGWHEARLKLQSFSCDTVYWHYWSRDNNHPDWEDQGDGWEYWIAGRDWRKISSDPSIDPAEPLRRELREAYRHIEDLYRTVQGCTCDPRDYEVEEWLARNAAFGGRKGDE